MRQDPENSRTSTKLAATHRTARLPLHASCDAPLQSAAAARRRNAMDMSVAGAPSALAAEQEGTRVSREALKHAFIGKLFYMQGKFPALATKRDYYLALAYVVRDRLLQRWVSTAAAYTRQRSRTVAYLSAEFLIGPQLGNNLVNLGIYHAVKGAIAELGLDFDELLQQ